MLDELKAIKTCLELENERGAIADTLWITRHETLFDYIDAAIEKAQALQAAQAAQVGQAGQTQASRVPSDAQASSGHALTDHQVDRLLRTSIPGGSHALDWFLPYANDKGLANIRDVVRLMLAEHAKHAGHGKHSAAAATASANSGDFDITEDSEDALLGIIAKIRNTAATLAPGMAHAEMLQAVGGPSEVPAYIEAVITQLMAGPGPGPGPGPGAVLAFDDWWTSSGPNTASSYDAARSGWDAASGHRAATLQQGTAASVPAAWRMRDTGFRKPHFVYFTTKEEALSHAAHVSQSRDDGHLTDLTPLFLPLERVTQAVPTFLQRNDLTKLLRFKETTEDDQSFDIPKDELMRLTELGVVRSEGFGRYSITAFGNHVCDPSCQFAQLPLKTHTDHEAAYKQTLSLPQGTSAQKHAQARGVERFTQAVPLENLFLSAMSIALEALEKERQYAAGKRDFSMLSLRAIEEVKEVFKAYRDAQPNNIDKHTSSLEDLRQKQAANSLAQEVIACFDAAEAEGLSQVLSETGDERLKDLVERRLMFALNAAQQAMADPVVEKVDVQHEISAALAMFPLDISAQSFTVANVNNGEPLKADGDTAFFSKTKVTAFLTKLHGHLCAAQAIGSV